MDDPWGSPWADEAALAPPDQKHEPALAEESPRKNPESVWDVDGSYGVWDQSDPIESNGPRAAERAGPAGGECSNEDSGWQSITPESSEFQDGHGLENGFESSLNSQDASIAEPATSIADTDDLGLRKDDDGIAAFPALDQPASKTDDVSLEANIEPDPAATEELSVDNSPAQDDKGIAHLPEVVPQEIAPSNLSTSKRSSTVSSHDEQNETAASSETSFELETRSSTEMPTEAPSTQMLEAPNSELDKSSIDLPSSDDEQLSTTGTISPSKPSDEQSGADDADFGDFEEEITDEPLDTFDAATPMEDGRSSHHHDASLRESPVFAIDDASVSNLFGNEAIAPMVPAKDSALLNDFSTVEQRKTWYRLSRYGSMQKHNMENDESYIQVKWPSSKTRDETLKIVARWMNQGRFGGAPALIGSGNTRSGTLFGWGEPGSTTPVDMASIWASRRSSPQLLASKSTTPTNSKPSTPRIDTFMSPPMAHKIIEVEKASPVSSPRLSQNDAQFAWSTPEIVSPMSKPLEHSSRHTTVQSPISPASEPLKLSQPFSKAKIPSPPIAPKAFHAPKPTSLLQQAASKRISLNLPANNSPIIGHRPSSSMVNIPHIAQDVESTAMLPAKASLKSPTEVKVTGLGLSMELGEFKPPEAKHAVVVPVTSFNTGLQGVDKTADVCKVEVEKEEEDDDDDEWGEMVESAPPTPSDFNFPPSPTFALSAPSTINDPVSQSIPGSHWSQDGLLKPDVKSHKPSMSLVVPFSPPLYTPPSPTLLQPNNSFRSHKPSLSVGGKPSSPERRITSSPIRNRQVAFVTPSYAMPTPEMARPHNSFVGHRPSMSVGRVLPSRPPRRQSRSPVDLRYGGSDFTLPSPTALRPGSASRGGHRPALSISSTPSPAPERRSSKSPVDLRYGSLQSEVDAIMSASSKANRRKSTPIGNVPELPLIDMGEDIRPARAPPSQLVATMEARRAHKHSASIGGVQAHSRPQPPPLATTAKGAYKPAASFDEILSPTRDFLAPVSAGHSLISLSISKDLYSLSNASATSPAATASGDFSLLSGLEDLPDNIAEHLSPVTESASALWKTRTQAEESQERDDEVVRRIIGGLPNFSYMLRRG